jgi:xylan 1,4-beta-xylosidase
MVMRLVLLSLFAGALAAQPPAAIRVDTGAPAGPLPPVWAMFGYDEPNYTYMKDGRKLLTELSALSPVPVYIRAHHLLVTGAGTAALKWGSTNAYTEDAAGKPVYDWTILDRIFDTYRATRTRPLVEIGFMPEALTTGPPPYRHNFPKTGTAGSWAYPPKSYEKFAALVHAWVKHAVERYGAREVEGWYWELWNEPNISYWRGTPEEYHKLYDYSADAVKRALPTARMGGPHSTGPGADRAAGFLRAFLEHCARGENYCTGKTGAPLDFIGFHAKGSPRVVDGRVRMGMDKQVTDIARGFEVVASFPEWKKTPIIIGESDPEGCAACPVATHPQNAYRNGTLYPCYTAAMLHHTLELAAARGVNLRGAVTWAFEFEDQPWFAGFRSLATNGVDKPVLNVFRMFGLMGPDRVKVSSSSALTTEQVRAGGVRAQADINALASRAVREVSVLAWNYHDDDAPAPDAPVELMVTGLPNSSVQVRHYRIDATHGNAYTAWKDMGSPQRPTPEQYARLEAAGQLQMLGSPEWMRPEGGAVRLRFALPRQAVSLVQVGW